MALTANTIPSQVTTFPTPYDATNAFTTSAGQTLTATGFLNNQNTQVDLGGANPVSAAGRTDGVWTLDVTSVAFGSANEFYQFALLGSNDPAFGAGNVELLEFYDIAATAALRIIPNTLGATPTIPPVGLGGMTIQRPFTNLQCLIYYRFLQCFLTVGGTSPSITVTSWISRAGIQV
jgi:hypothetical protein